MSVQAQVRRVSTVALVALALQASSSSAGSVPQDGLLPASLSQVISSAHEMWISRPGSPTTEYVLGPGQSTPVVRDTPGTPGTPSVQLDANQISTLKHLLLRHTTYRSRSEPSGKECEFRTEYQIAIPEGSHLEIMISMTCGELIVFEALGSGEPFKGDFSEAQNVFESVLASALGPR